MQVYMPTLEYEDDGVEKLYNTIEEILEEDGKVTKTSLYWRTGIALLERNHIGTLLDHMELVKGITRVNCSLTFLNEMD